MLAVRRDIRDAAADAGSFPALGEVAVGGRAPLRALFPALGDRRSILGPSRDLGCGPGTRSWPDTQRPPCTAGAAPVVHPRRIVAAGCAAVSSSPADT